MGIGGGSGILRALDSLAAGRRLLHTEKWEGGHQNALRAEEEEGRRTLPAGLAASFFAPVDLPAAVVFFAAGFFSSTFLPAARLEVAELCGREE